MTQLAERLAARIRLNGPITIAEYMAACLGDPEHGYYMRREVFGRGGDFVTAPEVSQIFGELIGLWAVEAWRRMGMPSPFVLAELGPGRGTLMADALRAARVRPEFISAVRVELFETSPRLREAQRAALAGAGVPVTWHDRVENVPAGPMILIANELFDALPVRQFVRTEAGWAERMVGIDEEGRLAFGLRPSSSPIMPGLVPGIHANTGGEEKDVDGRDKPGHDGGMGGVEISPTRTVVMSLVAERLARDGGAALVIDYGYEGPAFGDTLQAVRAHRYDDPLAHPGEADITAHVDFAALARAAEEAGALPRPVMTQGEFLARLGLATRAAALARDKDEATRASIRTVVERLAGETAMGRLFKVLAISAPGLALPVFDDNSGA